MRPCWRRCRFKFSQNAWERERPHVQKKDAEQIWFINSRHDHISTNHIAKTFIIINTFLCTCYPTLLTAWNCVKMQKKKKKRLKNKEKPEILAQENFQKKKSAEKRNSHTPVWSNQLQGFTVAYLKYGSDNVHGSCVPNSVKLFARQQLCIETACSKSNVDDYIICIDVMTQVALLHEAQNRRQ